jgi:hypothetical protein
MKTTIILILLITTTVSAQFDSLIFRKSMLLDEWRSTSIYPLGDQNGDGCDDIMLFDCNDNTGYIYFGGSPMDTIPDLSIQFFDYDYPEGNITVSDINDDGKNDLIVVRRKLLHDIGIYKAGDIRIY